MQRHLLFVYGTLMRGEPGHPLIADCRFEREARTPPCYRLIDVGGYPGLVVGGSCAVRGELFRVEPERVPRLDEYEDVPEQYVRRFLELADGTSAEAYFFHPERAARCPPIPSGDWRRR